MCLDDLPVHHEIHEEAKAFREVEIFPLKAQQQTPNTYSLVIEKRSVVPADEEPARFSLSGVPIACDEHVCVKKKDEKGMAMLAKRAEEQALKKAKKAKKEKKVTTKPPTTKADDEEQGEKENNKEDEKKKEEEEK